MATTKKSQFKPTNRKATVTKEQILEVLANNKGLIYNSLKQTGLSSSTFYRWMNDDPEFKKAVEETEQIEIDYVRSKLAQLIDEGNPQAIMFYAKCKNNFVETKKVEATVQAKDTVNIDLALKQIEEQIQDKE